MGEVDNKCLATITGPNGAVAISSANGLVGTGFASGYRIQPGRVFKDPMVKCKATLIPLLSHLPLNTITTNY